MGDTTAAGDRMRLDKWLWAARFFKTRSLAVQAVAHGRVRLNGERVKPAREVKSGDRLDIQIEALAWSVTVRELTKQRGPAAVAQTLYEEDPASVARRAERRQQHTLAPNPAAAIKGRPTKRDRRHIHRFTGA